MKVVTCVSDCGNADYLRFLRASCEYSRLDLVTLVFRGPWRSHRIKDVLLRRYLRSIPEDEIVLFTDGYDAMVLGTEAEILAHYAKFPTPVVFSAEKNCWPDGSLRDRFPTSGTPFRYLNSGGFIGVAGVLLELLDRCVSGAALRTSRLAQAGARFPAPESQSFPWSNQWTWSLVFFENPELISLDSRCELFLELGSDLHELEANRAAFAVELEGSALYQAERERINRSCTFDSTGVQHHVTGTRPCHVHFNGPVAKRLARNGAFDAAMPWLEQGLGRADKAAQG